MIPFLLFQLSAGPAAAIEPADGEIIYVLAADRTVGIGAADRTVAVTAEDRTILPPVRPTP